MGLIALPGAQDFTWQQLSVTGTRPGTAKGATVTPNAVINTKGNWAEVLTAAQMANDAWMVLININSNFVAAAARDTLVDIGIDPAGGTSYTVLIPDLLGSCAGPLNIGSGLWYCFPLHIPAGASVAARASINQAVGGTLRVFAQVFGLPRRPELCAKGTFCRAIGVVSGSSRGTTITSGTTSEGAWTSLGTTADDLWWWQLGMGVNDSTMTAQNIYACDLSFGDASNKDIIIEEQEFVVVSASEALATPGCIAGCNRHVKSGMTIYGRMQCSGTADSALSMAAYGVGG